MHQKRLGYARVWTVGQTLETQLKRLNAAECSTSYREKVSGAPPLTSSDRGSLFHDFRERRPGDTSTCVEHRFAHPSNSPVLHNHGKGLQSGVSPKAVLRVQSNTYAWRASTINETNKNRCWFRYFSVSDRIRVFERLFKMGDDLSPIIRRNLGRERFPVRSFCGLTTT